VVLVHGSLDRGASFSRAVRRLTDLHVITYDRRGYHGSRRVGPLATSLAEHSEDLVALIGTRPSVVVGHSYGGDVALGAALAAPEVVRAVGAYEPPLPWLDWWPRRNTGSGDGEDPGAFAESFFRRVVSDEAWERLTERFRADRRADGPALMAELVSLRAGAAPFDVNNLKVPLVLGRGSRSVWHHRRAVDALAAAVPGTEVVEIAGSGHGAHLSHPDAFADFVRRVVARGSHR
jgi:pimeloyl-ACP methyl ester carboxylesterase